MDTILNFIQANMPLIILVVVAIFVIRSGIFGRIGEAIGGAFGSAVPALSMVTLALIIMFGVITIFRPQFYTFLWGPGPLGPSQQVNRAEANLMAAVLDPANQPEIFPNKVARSAAESLKTEYQLRATKSLAEISAAEAERACRLPYGHIDRVLWDNAGQDPCERSLPPGIQAVARTIGKIDADATEKALSQPLLGSSPREAEGWIKQIYQLPKGLVLSGVLLLFVLAAGLMFGRIVRSVIRS